MHEMAHHLGSVVGTRGKFNDIFIPKLRQVQWDREIKADIEGMELLSEYLGHEYKNYPIPNPHARADYVSMNSALTCLDLLDKLETFKNGGKPISPASGAFKFQWSTHPPAVVRSYYIANCRDKKKLSLPRSNVSGTFEAALTMHQLLTTLFHGI